MTFTQKCPVTKKLCFPTKDAAAQFEQSNREKYGIAQQHEYACEDCGQYHLSALPRDRDPRLKMRAECSTDVGMMLVEAMEHGLTVHALEVEPWDPGVYSCDDVVATFVLRGPHISSDTGEIVNGELNRKETLLVIGKITDSHVMLDTLQPVGDYTGERQTPGNKPTPKRELPTRKRKHAHSNLLVFPAYGNGGVSDAN